MSVYSFITEPFRFVDKFDAGVRASYELARQIEIEGAFTSLANADTVAQILFDILKSPRQRFDVPVLGVDIINLGMFDGQVPAATLISDRFGLTAGKPVIIPDFTIDLNAGQTILRCWG